MLLMQFAKSLNNIFINGNLDSFKFNKTICIYCNVQHSVVIRFLLVLTMVSISTNLLVRVLETVLFNEFRYQLYHYIFFFLPFWNKILRFHLFPSILLFHLMICWNIYIYNSLYILWDNDIIFSRTILGKNV